MFIDPINVMTHHGRTISTIKGSTHQHQPCMMDPKSEFRLLVQSLHGKTKKACVYTRTHFAKVWRITYRVCCCDSCGAPCSLLWPWSDFSGHFRGNSVSIGHATTVSMQSLATVLSRVGLAVILDTPICETAVGRFSYSCPGLCVCLLLQDLLQSCSRGGAEESGGHVL